jgi:integrase
MPVFLEPFRTMALVCVCFGLRISECLVLGWSDVDWLRSTLCVERGIVHQVVDDVKTPESQKSMHIDSDILQVLKMWKQLTQFREAHDWMFAFSGANRTFAILLRGSVASTPKISGQGWHWSPQLAYLPAHPQIMARRCWHLCGRTAAADAAH